MMTPAYSGTGGGPGGAGLVVGMVGRVVAVVGGGVTTGTVLARSVVVVVDSGRLLLVAASVVVVGVTVAGNTVVDVVGEMVFLAEVLEAVEVALGPGELATFETVGEVLADRCDAAPRTRQERRPPSQRVRLSPDYLASRAPLI